MNQMKEGRNRFKCSSKINNIMKKLVPSTKINLADKNGKVSRNKK